jgi:adenylate cyclase
MLTDIVGFTSLAQRDEALALRLLKENNQLIRQALREYGGREVKTIGDAFLIEFKSVLQAVNCSITIQNKMHEKNLSVKPANRVELRIGVHLGDVVESGTDILGDAVNVSSRIQPLAESGGICISQQVYDHVRNKINFKLRLIEGARLKNVNDPVNVYEILMPWKGESEQGVEALDTRRIAVMPLKNMSPDPNDEYFADGMTEELITALSGVRELTVIARTSIMQYKSTPKRALEIGRDLRTGTLIEGSIRKAANKVRITIQLIDVASEGHLWAQNYDRTMDDIFAIQSEIAEKVADALRIRLAGEEKKKLEARHKGESVEGFTLYLKGRHYWNERSEAGLTKAVEYFSEAIKRDPKFALGYAGLADCYYVLRGNFGIENQGYLQTKELALKAISLDESIAEPHATLGAMFHYVEHNFRKADEEFRRAIELNPNYATAHQWYAHLFVSTGEIDAAVEEIYKALELDPLSPIINVNVGDALYYSGKLAESLKFYEKAREILPGFVPSYYSEIQPLCYLKMFNEVLEIIDEYARIAKSTTIRLLRAYVSAHMGKRDEARKTLMELEVELESDHGSFSWYFVALAYFLLGNKDKGFELLEKAYDLGEHEVLNLQIDNELDDVRSDPRYLSMLQKIGFR